MSCEPVRKVEYAVTDETSFVNGGMDRSIVAEVVDRIARVTFLKSIYLSVFERRGVLQLSLEGAPRKDTSAN